MNKRQYYLKILQIYVMNQNITDIRLLNLFISSVFNKKVVNLRFSVLWVLCLIKMFTLKLCLIITSNVELFVSIYILSFSRYAFILRSNDYITFKNPK